MHVCQGCTTVVNESNSSLGNVMHDLMMQVLIVSLEKPAQHTHLAFKFIGLHLLIGLITNL